MLGVSKEDTYDYIGYRELWIVGRVPPTETRERIYICQQKRSKPFVWEFIGIAEDKYRAEELCEDMNDFIAPVTCNSKKSYYTKVWPKAYYPKRRQKNG